MGRSRKVSFKFLHTLWVYRLCIYLLVYEKQLSPIFLWVSKFDVKFQNLMSSCGSWSKISKLEQIRDFSSGGSKSSLRLFYPPEGLCRAEPERGPIVFTLHFIGVG